MTGPANGGDTTDDEAVADGVRAVARRASGGQLAAVAGGAALVGSYVVPWIEVASGAFTTAGATTISAREVQLVPELVAVLGLLTVVLAAVRWTRNTQLVVLVAGLTGTGLALFVRFFLDSDEEAIRVGEHVGPPAAFDPALGPTIALGASLLVVAAGFIALLRGLPDLENATD